MSEPVQHPAPARADQSAAPDPAGRVPAEIRELLGPAPITRLENGESYERLLSKTAEAVEPRDFLEWSWVKDVVDLIWEAARARRAKAAALALARKAAIKKILAIDQPEVFSGSAMFDRQNRIETATQEVYSSPDGLTSEAFRVALAHLGLTSAAIDDAAYGTVLETMERLERLIDNANSRRDAVFREIDRRRDSLARRLREAVRSGEEILDAEFEDAADAG